MKAWAWAIIALAVIGAIGGVYAKGHAAGYNKRDLEAQKEIVQAQVDSAENLLASFEAGQAATEATIVVEEKIVEKIREVEVEVPTVVEQIVEVTPECADLGDAYAGLLNNQVSAGNGIQIAAPADPADAGVQDP